MCLSARKAPIALPLSHQSIANEVRAKHRQQQEPSLYSSAAPKGDCKPHCSHINKKKDDLVRTLRERGYRDDLADPIVKWKNKDLVQALMKSDLERDGANMKDTGAPDD